MRNASCRGFSEFLWKLQWFNFYLFNSFYLSFCRYHKSNNFKDSMAILECPFRSIDENLYLFSKLIRSGSRLPSGQGQINTIKKLFIGIRSSNKIIANFTRGIPILWPVGSTLVYRQGQESEKKGSILFYKESWEWKDPGTGQKNCKCKTYRRWDGKWCASSWK